MATESKKQYRVYADGEDRGAYLTRKAAQAEASLMRGFGAKVKIKPEMEQLRFPRSNPPSGFIPCRAVKITRNRGKVEVRIRK